MWRGGGSSSNPLVSLTTIIRRKYLSARRLSNCHNNTQRPPLLPIKEKSFKHALNQSSVTNKWSIVFQSNTTRCFIVFQSWTIIVLLFSWLEDNWLLLDWKTIANWLLLDWKTIEHWLENNRPRVRYASMI